MANKTIDISINQRLAIAKAYLDERVPMSTIAELTDISVSQVSIIARQVLGDKHFKSRYKKNQEAA